MMKPEFEQQRLKQRIARAIGLFLMFLAVSAHPRAQVVLITFDHPFQAQKLAGVVLDPTGASVMGVLIEDCDPTFKRVRASTRTDENGRFAFRKGKAGTIHFLRVSKDGFDPMRMTVQLKPTASAELEIKLYIAT
jgi:hypothetical protein